MFHRTVLLCVLLASSASVIGQTFAEEKTLTLDLSTRDSQSGSRQSAQAQIDPAKTGVVVIDPWNFHWCMTACQRVDAMVPRWNRVLGCARQLGMQVIWCPTDVASQYVGTLPRERALAVPYLDAPKVRDLTCRFTAGVGPCMCGPGLPCVVNYGWDGIHPGLIIADEDLIASGLQEIYSACKQKGLTHLIYTGLHTNMCLFGKPPALRNMYAAGFECYVARDLNDAFTHYNPQTGFTPDSGTAQIDDDLERAGIPTINMLNEVRKAAVWDDAWIVETVRIAPWGTTARPYQFTQSVTVTLTAPWLENIEIRYTLDGTDPDPDSPRYDRALTLDKTTDLKVVAFRDGKRASLESQAYFSRLGPIPPKPEVYLDELKPMQRQYGSSIWFWHPAVNRSYEGKPLRIRGQAFDRGLGMRAPANLRYELAPDHDRFVALAGVDDHLLDQNHGRFLAMHSSVRFSVYIDGQLAAQSPVMRISQAPWRFDVKIPKGSRRINLVTTDAESRSEWDLGNWCDAGFILAGSAPR